MAFLYPLASEQNQRGFTLIELIVVVAISAVLFSMVAYSVTEMVKRGRVAKAQGDLSTIGKAIRQLELDTGKFPNKEPGSSCALSDNDTINKGGLGNEIALDDVAETNSNTARSGLLVNYTSNPFPNWKGPYIDKLPKDPWKRNYIYDGDYQCVAKVVGCEDALSGITNDRVIFSAGQNGVQYDADDIVYVFCSRPS